MWEIEIGLVCMCGNGVGDRIWIYDFIIMNDVFY